MLAAGTKEVHEKAENTQFVKDFLRGRIRKELFKASLEKIEKKVSQFDFIKYHSASKKFKTISET